MKRILVTGGTGGLGREIVQRLIQTEHCVRVMSRKNEQLRVRDWPDVEWIQADLVTGEGLKEAVSGVDTIIHAATKSAMRKDGIDFRTAMNTSDNVDVGGTRLLLEQARIANIQHFIYVSIVGMERVPYYYYTQKLAAEKLVIASGIPWTIMRATQFHPFINSLLRQVAHFPIMALVTDLQFQPVDTGEVAAYLCSLVEQAPAGYLPDFGGPEIHTLGELAKIWLKIQDIHKPIVHTPLPIKAVAALRKGYVTNPQRKCGTITWAEWVQQQVAPSTTATSSRKPV